jgi:uncharacterized protein YecT (DUF1311 family)
MNFLRNWLFLKRHHHSCNRTIASARELALHGARQRQQAWIALRDAKTEQLRREIELKRARGLA